MTTTRRQRAGSADSGPTVGESSPKKQRKKEAGLTTTASANPRPPEANIATPEDDYFIDEEESEKILRMMGIKSFSTSKGKDHSASDCYGVMKVQKRKTRQMVRPKTGKAT